jgi:hypothetical protein
VIAVWIIGSFVAGFAVEWAIRQLKPASAAPLPSYVTRLAAASGATRTLDEVVDALRAEALRVEVRLDGVDVVDQLDATASARFGLRVPDAKQVSIGSIRCSDSPTLDLPFTIALALVPLYGPITLTLVGEVYEIDGTRDRHQLVRELSRRQTAKLQEALGRVARG